MTLILAIDAATAKTGIVLARDGETVQETAWVTRHNQTVELLPRLKTLLSSAGIGLGDIDAIAVTRGPGSYNGVRVGIANAKGLAFALSKPLIGVSTLEAEAYRHQTENGEIYAILPLGHDYAVAGFKKRSDEWLKELSEQAMTVDQVAEILPPGAKLAGELPERLLEQLRVLRPDTEYLGENGTSRALAAAWIGRERFDNGNTDTAASLQPLYLRRPQVTPPKIARDISGLPGRGVIWDMDGVIIDSAKLHFESWREALGKRGIEMNRAQFDATFGRRNDDIIAHVTGRPAIAGEAKEIGDEKERAFRRMVAGQARAFPGVLELIRALKESGFKQAIASSAPPENVALVIREMSLEDLMDATVDATQVSAGKPDPEVFLKAADKLGLGPGSCLVIEDAVAGVEAARRAGMPVIAVSNTHPAERLKAADLVVGSLEEIDAARILEMINEKKDSA